jgi:phosphopantothenoylcysteine decarboxylase/phosphopantothenate--cysteine ligase
MSLHNKNILVGVTGSIAAYKACDLVQRLKEKGAHVRVVMTHSATRIIQPAALAALSGNPVLTDAWDGVSDGGIPHIEAARWADLFVVSPCTAHTLAELSYGLTGSPVSMTALAYKGPLAVAPAMNTVMLTSAPVVEHIDRLTARGVHVLPTLNGALACGEVGEGKLTTPEEITAYAALILAFEAKSESTATVTARAVPQLAGKTVVISGGHTEEPLDGVRFLSNRSSGKTAIVIARAFRLAGATVRLVLGRADEPEPNGIPLTRVTTSAQFRDVLNDAQPAADVIVMAAAIADFVPSTSPAAAGEKWKASRDLKALELSPAPNILAELGAHKPVGQVLVGFALETKDALAHARHKLEERRCDLLVVNTPLSPTTTPSGFGEDHVEAAVLTSGLQGESDGALRLMTKAALAAALVQAVTETLTARDRDA